MAGKSDLVVRRVPISIGIICQGNGAGKHSLQFALMDLRTEQVYCPTCGRNLEIRPPKDVKFSRIGKTSRSEYKDHGAERLGSCANCGSRVFVEGRCTGCGSFSSDSFLPYIPPTPA